MLAAISHGDLQPRHRHTRLDRRPVLLRILDEIKPSSCGRGYVVVQGMVIRSVQGGLSLRASRPMRFLRFDGIRRRAIRNRLLGLRARLRGQIVSSLFLGLSALYTWLPRRRPSVRLGRRALDRLAGLLRFGRERAVVDGSGKGMVRTMRVCWVDGMSDAAVTEPGINFAGPIGTHHLPTQPVQFVHSARG